MCRFWSYFQDTAQLSQGLHFLQHHFCHNITVHLCRWEVVCKVLPRRSGTAKRVAHVIIGLFQHLSNLSFSHPPWSFTQSIPCLLRPLSLYLSRSSPAERVLLGEPSCHGGHRMSFPEATWGPQALSLSPLTYSIGVLACLFPIFPSSFCNPRNRRSSGFLITR